MKLLLDQGLPRSSAALLREIGIDTIHLGEVDMSAAPDESVLVSPLRLQKLLYYCQGWSLALLGRPLFRQPIEAWMNGPVVKDVYQKATGDRTMTFMVIEDTYRDGEELVLTSVMNLLHRS